MQLQQVMSVPQPQHPLVLPSCPKKTIVSKELAAAFKKAFAAELSSNVTIITEYFQVGMGLLLYVCVSGLFEVPWVTGVENLSVSNFERICTCCLYIR
jgi:hypothetical protein